MSGRPIYTVEINVSREASMRGMRSRRGGHWAELKHPDTGCVETFRTRADARVAAGLCDHEARVVKYERVTK